MQEFVALTLFLDAPTGTAGVFSLIWIQEITCQSEALVREKRLPYRSQSTALHPRAGQTANFALQIEASGKSPFLVKLTVLLVSVLRY